MTHVQRIYRLLRQHMPADKARYAAPRIAVLPKEALDAMYYGEAADG